MLEVAREPCSPTVTLAGVISVYSITSALKSVFYKVTHHAATPLPVSTTGYKILFPSRPCQAAYGLFKATTTASLGTVCLGAVRNWFPLIHVWGCIGSWHGMARHQVDLCLLLMALACTSHSAHLPYTPVGWGTYGDMSWPQQEHLGQGGEAWREDVGENCSEGLFCDNETSLNLMTGRGDLGWSPAAQHCTRSYSWWDWLIASNR